jgi:single-strand DNA-binding protein
MNEDRITVTGVVGSDPRPYLSSKGLPITTFRLASSPRVFDRERGEWRDGETNWYSVSAFRRLADNTALSLRKGEHVVVTGKLRLRAWQTAEKSGTSAEIDADAIGHDLSWAVTRAQRLQPRTPADGTGADGALLADGAMQGAASSGTPTPADRPDADADGDAYAEPGFDDDEGEALGGVESFADPSGAVFDPAAAGERDDAPTGEGPEAGDEPGESDDAHASDAAGDEGGSRAGMFSFGRR